MEIEVSNGEIVDKLTILLIKQSKIENKDKLNNINKEITAITKKSEAIIPRDHLLFYQLLEVNKKLWDVEDKIRAKESLKEFDETFINLARSVYILNDERAKIKKQINESTGSELMEEKSYESY
jgi:hypothetical protein